MQRSKINVSYCAPERSAGNAMPGMVRIQSPICTCEIQMPRANVSGWSFEFKLSKKSLADDEVLQLRRFMELIEDILMEPEKTYHEVRKASKMGRK